MNADKDVVGTAADDGTLMHYLSRAVTSNWMPAAGRASMLYLLVRAPSNEPTATREASAGVQLLRQVLSSPATNEALVSAQLSWLTANSGTAGALVLKLAETSTDPWVVAQLKALWDAGALRLSPDELSKNWSVVRRALGTAFESLLASLMSESQSRQTLLESVEGEAEFVLDVVQALDTQDGVPKPARTQIFDWAARVVAQASREVWLESFHAASGGPLVALVSALTSAKAKVPTVTHLDDAVHDFAREVQDGQTGWRPTGADFWSLVSRLDAPARSTVASQLCAELEGRDSVDPAFFAVYGEFLKKEKSFREHEKLFSVVERFLTRGDEEALAFFADLAKAQPAAFRRKGREDSFDHLKRKLNEKLEELGDTAPEPLVTLAAQLD